MGVRGRSAKNPLPVVDDNYVTPLRNRERLVVSLDTDEFGRDVVTFLELNHDKDTERYNTVLIPSFWDWVHINNAKKERI